MDMLQFTSWGLVNVVDTLKPVIIYNGGGKDVHIIQRSFNYSSNNIIYQSDFSLM